MSRKNQSGQPSNRREQITGFVHVSLLFVFTTAVCCFILSSSSNSSSIFTRKEIAADKMERIRQFRSVQSEQAVIVEAVNSMISVFDPNVQASYIENDINYYLNNIRSLYEKSNYDSRFKIFYHTADFYNMWFADKRELWNRSVNISDFKKNLEDCLIGIQREQNELTNIK